ncbi:hypothetical protein H6F67_20240 [Microcoleus sp. FACHB-1515]|uniref:hypothetical protein n=1 Tax=Cyanophyceae TaxID=3028117 RepID=UPI0016823A6F|nr:hypothetical protein [Microcoleus sp. FACHB-1515]MBD2092183.1 hypothetical protein [Microcoleus sp. FACHB-1515]
MTQDVRQWLAEIESLRQSIDRANQEREEAYASAARWRSLYETEAKQRRSDAAIAQQSIARLQAELDVLRSPSSIAVDAGSIESIAEMPPDALKERLATALSECDRLMQALRAEQAEHAKTRKDLTSALGDTVDLLAKERAKNPLPAPPPPASE